MGLKCLITGGSSELGMAIAKRLLTLPYISCVSLHYYKHKPKMNGVNVIQSDLTLEHPLWTINKATALMEGLDIVINCVGKLAKECFSKCTIDDYEDTMDVNTKSVFFVCQAAFNFFKKQKSGKIINISSFCVDYGMGRNETIHYAIGKAAINTLTIGLAKLAAPHNIQVNAISPGVIRGKNQKGREHLKDRIPLGRMGKTEDVVNIVEYLVSNKSDFITGENIRVAGGE